MIITPITQLIFTIVFFRGKKRKGKGMKQQTTIEQEYMNRATKQDKIMILEWILSNL